MSVELVVFDLGGVLVRRTPRLAVERASAALGVAPERVAQAVSEGELLDSLERGHITPEQYYHGVCDRLGKPWSYEAFVEAWNCILSEDVEATSLLSRLRPHYRLAVLTNTNALHDEHIRGSWPSLGQVHYWVASYEVGMMKPDPAIYELVLQRAGIPARLAVYVDDMEPFVDAARQVGMMGIHLPPGASLAHELRAVGVRV